MFRIKNSTIHCSRGDVGTIKLKIPITDVNNYIKYKDNSTPSNTYWYDMENKVLYDSYYQESSISIDTLTMVYYEFKEGDVVIFNIYEKNGYNKPTLKTKSVTVIEPKTYVEIVLNENDTTFGTISNKEATYWYDITLNDDNTVVCFDENGAKEFILYPAKGSEE